MDIAWIACDALLWGILILLVWGYQRLAIADPAPVLSPEQKPCSSRPERAAMPPHRG